MQYEYRMRMNASRRRRLIRVIINAINIDSE